MVFLACFFLEGLNRHLSLKGNDLRLGNSQQSKNAFAKVLNILPETFVFLPNSPVFRVKTGLLKKRDL